MFGWIKKKIGSKGKSVLVGICLILSILTMTIATFAWFTTIQPGTDKVVLTSDDNSVVVDAYAYKPGYTTDSNGDPVEIAHDNHSSTPLLAATKVKGAGSATYTVTFSSDALSTFSYSSLYGDELYQNEKNYPHVYIELRYTKATLNGFVKAMVKNLAYAGAKTGYTNITSNLKYEYRTVTEQNTTTGTKYINGFTAAYADTAYTASSWTTVTNNTADFSLYNNTTDIAGYNYGSSYVMQNQCFVPGYPYKYDSTNYYFSKATFLEFRVNPLSWLTYFQNNTTTTSSSSTQYNLGLYNFGVSFDVALDFSGTPYYDSAASTSPRVALSSSVINMKPSTTNSTVTVTTFNFDSAPTFAVAASNDSIVSGSVNNGILTLTTTAVTGITTVTVTATAGTQTAQALITVRASGPTLTLSTSSISIKMGGSGSVVASTYNFDNAVTLSAVSNGTTIATVSMTGASITITPVSIGTTTMTVTATDGTATRTADCSIVVTAADKTLSSIAVTTMPSITSYVVGDVLDTTGCVITATWSDQSTTVVTPNCTFSPTDLDTAGTQIITVSYGGKTTSFNVTVKAASQVTTYQLVTSTSDLVAGDDYVIAGYNNSATTWYALGIATSASTTYRPEVAVTVSNEILTSTSDTEVITLGMQDGLYTLYSNSASSVTNQGAGYFCAVSSNSNYLETKTTVSVNSEWTLTLDTSTNKFAVEATSSSYSHNLFKFNASGARFSCYSTTATNMSDLYFYHAITSPSGTKTLSSLTMVAEPTKTIYTVGENLDTTGLSIRANYSDDTNAIVTNYTLNPVNGSLLNTVGETSVTVTYTEGGVTKTTSFTVNVNPAPESIAVTTLPTKTTYTAGETFSTAGMVVTGTYSGGSTGTIVGYTTSPASGTVLNTAGTQTITVTYGALTTNFTVTVTGVVTGTAVYTVSSTSTVSTSGTMPSGSSVTYSSTYASAKQLTSGYSMTWSFSGLSNVTITSLTFSMHSNSSKGAGTLAYTTNGTTTYLVGSGSSGVAFSSSDWYGAWSTTYVDVAKTVSITCGSTLQITIAATANSLYCEKLTMGWSQTV